MYHQVGPIDHWWVGQNEVVGDMQSSGINGCRVFDDIKRHRRFINAFILPKMPEAMIPMS